MYIVQYTVYIVHHSQYNIQCTFYTIHNTKYNVHCTLYSVYSTLCTIHIYTIQCTVRTLTRNGSSIGQTLDGKMINSMSTGWFVECIGDEKEVIERSQV